MLQNPELHYLDNAATTYVGQNVGAGRMDRVRQGTRATLAMGVVWCFAIAAVLMPLSRPIMLLFSKTPAVVDAGVLYLWQLGIHLQNKYPSISADRNQQSIG